MSEKESVHSQVSEEFTEIVSNTPHWILKWGLFCLFSVFFLLFILSWFVKYPYIITARFRLVSTSHPQVITTHNSGRLRELKIIDGARVQDNQVLGYLESTANANDVIKLNKDLHNLYFLLSSTKQELRMESDFLQNYQLGDLQKNYEVFHKNLVDFTSTFKSGYYQNQRDVIYREILQMQKLKSNLSEQKTMKERDMSISQERLSIQKKLLEKKIISVSELRNEESNYITKSLPYKESSSSLINLDLSILTKKRELLEVEQLMNSSRENLIQSTKSLLSDIEKWSAEFVIKAQSTGNIIFINPIQNGQYIKQNTDLFYIVNEKNIFIGELMIDQKELGKVRLNQNVHIKFQGYPYQEYGFVYGKIKTISNVPLADSMYKSYVTLPQDLMTNSGTKLSPRWGMIGDAEIITDDTRVIYRLLSGIIPK